MSARANQPSKLVPLASRVPASRPAPQPARSQQAQQASRVSAPQEARIVAPGGASDPRSAGMGIPMPAPLPDEGEPGRQQAVELLERTFTGSSATRDFLRVNTIRNTDLKLVDVVGATLFDRKVGVHIVPIQAYTDSIAAAQTREGAYVIGNGQALIVTRFQPFAAIPNVGLPGAWNEIDPLSLLGQVSFYLTAQGGGQPLNQQTITSGSRSPAGGSTNGTPILSPIVGEQHPPMTATIKTGSVQAVYQVSNPPFPGWPRVVGVRMKGYLIDGPLYNAIMDTVIAGNINKLNKDVE